MGFTIDMVNGNISDITGRIAEETPEESASTHASVDERDTFTEEKMLPVNESYTPTEAFKIPGFIIDGDVDSLIDEMSSD